MRLFAENGYDGTTIGEIAAAADVAPRTVQQYFPSKHDIALSLANEVAGRFTAVLQSGPQAGFLDAVDVWLRGEAELHDPDLMALNQAMYEANPGLRALGSSQLTDVVQAATSAMTAETGLPADDPLYAIVAAALGAALAQYIGTAHLYKDDPDLHAHVIACLRALLDTAKATNT